MTYHFLLGGRDLEMKEIAALLSSHNLTFHDQKLDWGAGLSAYRQVLEQLPPAHVPVSIELANDLAGTTPWRDRLIEIDHHGARMGQPSSLRQVFDLLDLPAGAWTRHHSLVEANDVGHVSAMREFGASLEEMITIRAADRAAQGITPEQEVHGLTALEAADVCDGVTIAALQHNRAAALTDPHALDPRFGHLPRPLLILMPSEINYFGTPDVARELYRLMAGWLGGNPPHSAFWGVSGTPEEMVERWELAKTKVSSRHRRQ